MPYLGRPLGLLVIASAALLPVGCGDGNQLHEITGNVTLKNQPLNEGVIEFIPLDGGGTKSGAPISNGEYTVPQSSGLAAGKYRVRITAGDGTNPVDSDEPPGPTGSQRNIVSRDRIPREWNINSKKEVEVRKDQPNRFDFDIK